MDYLVNDFDLQDRSDGPKGLDPRTIVEHQLAFQERVLPADIGDELTADLLALNQQPGTSTQLATFYTTYVLPYGVMYVMHRLVRTLGYNLRKNGIIQFNDTENIGVPVSETARATLIQVKRAERNSYRMRMLRRLHEKEFLFDGKQYKQVHVRDKPKGSIGAVSSRTRDELTQNKRRL